MHAVPFNIEIPDHALADLRRRLRDTRVPLLTPAAPWQQGVDGAWLRDLTEYWAERFDWRAAEQALNRLLSSSRTSAGSACISSIGAARGRIRIRS